MLFSVVMSAYNAERFIESSVSSIISQTYNNWELLVIDDASSDRTYKILKYFTDRDSRIKLFRQDGNKGLTYNLNLLIFNAKGEYIIRQDADDISMPERFEAIYDYIKDDNLSSLIYSYCYIIDDEDNLLCLARPEKRPNLIEEALTNGHNPIMHGSIAFKKKDVLKIGRYCSQVIKGQDFDLYLRLIFNKMRFGCLSRPVYKHRVHELSINQGHFDKNTLNYRAFDREIYAEASLSAYHDNYRKTYNYYLDSITKNKRTNKMYPKGYSECLYAMFGDKRKYMFKKLLFLIKNKPLFLKTYLIFFLSFMPFNLGKLILSKRTPYTTFITPG